MDSGGEEDHVGPEHLLDQSDGDCGSFVDHQELCLGQLGHILRLNVLNRLAVILEDVDSHDGVVEFGIRRLQDVVVGMLPVVQCIKPSKEELKDR